MAKVANFPSFVSSYRALKANQGDLVLVELYHHDVMSEPSLSIVSHMDSVFADNIEGTTHIGIRIDGGTDLSFNDKNYNTNISDGAVIFSSKHDSETYCIIDSMEKDVI